jgi:hypothetical protein
MAGDARAKSFGEGAAKASAADRIAQYNAQAQQRAQQYNLGIPQQNYENQRQHAGDVAGVQRDWANYLGGRATQQAQQTADMGAGAGKLGGGIYDAITQRTANGGATVEDPYATAPKRLDEEGY